MNITKYQHACFTVEINNKLVVVDPGKWSEDYTPSQGISAVVVTHEHSDHCHRETLEAIVDQNPEVKIYAHESVCRKLIGLPTVMVESGQAVQVDDFVMRFTGGEHASIDRSVGPIANLGIMINETLYYPGDSFALPDGPVETLAVPVSGPWMKLSEALDFIREVQPRTVFPTHDKLLSNIGKKLVDDWCITVCDEFHASFTRLD